jgi:hypothetical protein
MGLRNLNIELVYGTRDENTLLPALRDMERKLGAERRPYAMRAGAIDLVSVVEIAVTFVVLHVVVAKYLEGFLGTSELEKAGQAHREAIARWFSGVEEDISRVVTESAALFTAQITTTSNDHFDRAVVLLIPFRGKSLYICLNHRGVTPQLISRLPGAIARVMRLINDGALPNDGIGILQLYFDAANQDWRYLFVPTDEGFGHWIDRYVDMETNRTIRVASPKDFIDAFRIEPRDQYKFLVNPFRELRPK